MTEIAELRAEIAALRGEVADLKILDHARQNQKKAAEKPAEPANSIQRKKFDALTPEAKSNYLRSGGKLHD